MKINVEIAEKRFAHFNRLIFKGKLKPVPILLSRTRTKIGACHFTRVKNLTGTAYTDFNLRFSVMFDLKPREWDDIIIHEMIHYYIGVNGYRDTSPHGKLFKQLMNDINKKFGRNVTISHRNDKAATADAAGQPASRPLLPAVKHRYRFVAVATCHDGRHGYKVLPAVYESIVKYYRAASGDPNIAKVELFQSNNDYFGLYPSSAALKIYYFKEGDYEKMMVGAVPMVIDEHSVHKA